MHLHFVYDREITEVHGNQLCIHYKSERPKDINNIPVKKMVERLHIPRHIVVILCLQPTFLITSYLGLAVQSHCFGVIPY